VPLARALVAGGLRAIEVTLRTRTALESIRRIAGEVEGAVVGAGTVLERGQLRAALDAGARFLVSPGSTPALLDAAGETMVPLLPGAATASEVMNLLSRDFRVMKLFPAEAVGGIKLLRSLCAPLPAALFCPTGGIGLENAPSYLSLPNVACVGGSWVAPADAVAAGDWARIETLSREAAALPRKASVCK
jgi:2-dehydro-3-deoxyphosphogluconate aldolase/(4S)-4-hydroxy-2-oxoglutarate aldolase